MPRSLFLPPEDETTVRLNFPGTDKEPVDVDIFALEDIFIKASDLAKEMGTKWQKQAPSLLKKSLNIEVNSTQCILMYGALQSQISDTKKKLLQQS